MRNCGLGSNRIRRVARLLTQQTDSAKLPFRRIGVTRTGERILNATFNPISGTILMGAKTPNYVILAADRQCSSYDDSNPTPDMKMVKISYIPGFPLAIANGGYAFLKNSSVSQRIKLTLSLLVEDESCGPNEVFAEIVKDLYPLVQETRVIARKSGFDPYHVVLYGGMFVGESPSLRRVIITDRDPNIEEIDGNGSINSSTHLTGFYRELLDSNPNFFGCDLLTVESHSDHMRKAIQLGINHEREIRPGLPPTAGGDIDVVVVDYEGCMIC
jgi:hypothetical protein